MKKILILILISFVLIGVFFHHAIYTFLLSSAFQIYFEKHFGYPLSYHKVLLEGENLIFIKPRFEEKMLADQLNFRYFLDISKRHIDLFIELERPLIYLEEVEKQFNELNLTKVQNHSDQDWIQFKTNYSLKNGVLTLPLFHHPLYFNLSMDHQWIGNVTASCGHLATEKDTYHSLHQSSNIDTECGVFQIGAISHKDGIELDLHCVGLNCVPFIELFKKVYPTFDQWAISSGTLTGKLKTFIPNEQNPYFEGWLAVENFEVTHGSLNGYVEKVEVMLEKNIVDQRTTSVGKLEFLKPASISYGTWKFNQDFGTVTLTDSMLNMKLGGVKGTLFFDWIQKNELFTFNLEGQARDIAKFIPDDFRNAFDTHFHDDKLGLTAKVKKRGSDMEVSGTAHIKTLPDKYDVIHFAGLLNENMNFISGSFSARHLPLEKYLSAFLFRPGFLELSGIGEFKGGFDGHKLLVKYDVENFKLENEYFLLEAKDLHSKILGDFRSFHEINIDDLTQFGELPLCNATYLDKNNKLLFEDIHGLVSFKDRLLEIRNLEAYCKDVYFAGSLNLDYRDPSPEIFNLTIQSPIIIGKVSQMQKLLSHFNSGHSLISQMTLEGDLSGRNNGMELVFNFFPHEYHLKADIQGSISHGWLPFESADMSLKGLFLDFDYHHDQGLLEFSDIQGSLLIGKPRQVEEYQFVGRQIRFNDLKKQDVNLDISIKDHDEEILRIVANTDLVDSGVRHVNLDQSLSHVSHIYPQSFVCKLNGTDIETFKFESYFDLHPLIQNLSRFRRSGLLYFSPHMIEKIVPLNPFEGKMKLNLNYQPLDKSIEFSLIGSNIEIDQTAHHKFNLKGKKRNKRWVIDQFQWDKLNIFAELQPEEDKWKVFTLGFNDGENLLLGLQGNYFPDQCTLNAQVNLCVYKGESYDLKNLEIKFINDLFQFSTHTNFQQCPFQIISESRWPSFCEGNIVFNDYISDKPVNVNWIKNNHEMVIRSVQGDFCGLSCDLRANDSVASQSDWSVLQGRVDLDFNSLCPLLTQETSAKIAELSLNSSYLLDGLYWFNSKSLKPALENLFFKGTMTSLESQIKGYQFSKIEAAINYSPDQLEMTKLTVNDHCGTLFAPSIIATKNSDKDDWSIKMPQATIRKFRPSILRNPNEETTMSPRFKNLVFKKIELQDFSGYLFDSNTWQASGGLHFQNTSRKNMFHPLLAIPNEIILRLGLDPSVLNPVTGNVYFNLKNGRFYLIRMKDVFSEGRGSKFYLSDASPSWMDLDGNISIHIRMKQYNLIFKIAELFTVTVEGNIQKPTYTLQKAKDK